MGAGSEKMPPKPIGVVAAALIGVLAVCVASGQEPGNLLEEAARDFARRQIENAFRSMNRPFPPFRIIGNLNYVGASDVASYLVATPEGLILINSGFEDTVPMIREAVRKLGFRFEEIKVLLNSHAHIDHASGHALLKKLTGARIVMSRADAELLANGGKGDFLPVREDVVELSARQGGPDHRQRESRHARRRDAHRPLDARPHQGLHHLDDGRRRRGEDLQRRHLREHDAPLRGVADG